MKQAHSVGAVEQSLRLLGIDYLNLYLIHWVCGAAYLDVAGDGTGR